MFEGDERKRERERERERETRIKRCAVVLYYQV